MSKLSHGYSRARHSIQWEYPLSIEIVVEVRNVDIIEIPQGCQLTVL